MGKKIITAAEARNAIDENDDMEVSELLSDIMDDIQDAVNDNMNSVKINIHERFGFEHDEVMDATNKLKSLGYDVTVHDGSLIITW